MNNITNIPPQTLLVLIAEAFEVFLLDTKIPAEEFNALCAKDFAPKDQLPLLFYLISEINKNNQLLVDALKHPDLTPDAKRIMINILTHDLEADKISYSMEKFFTSSANETASSSAQSLELTLNSDIIDYLLKQQLITVDCGNFFLQNTIKKAVETVPTSFELLLTLPQKDLFPLLDKLNIDTDLLFRLAMDTKGEEVAMAVADYLALSLKNPMAKDQAAYLYFHLAIQYDNAYAREKLQTFANEEQKTQPKTWFFQTKPRAITCRFFSALADFLCKKNETSSSAAATSNENDNKSLDPLKTINDCLTENASETEKLFTDVYALHPEQKQALDGILNKMPSLQKLYKLTKIDSKVKEKMEKEHDDFFRL